jgi:hypothetical protein
MIELLLGVCIGTLGSYYYTYNKILNNIVIKDNGLYISKELSSDKFPIINSLF